MMGGVFEYPAMERVIFGQPATSVLANEFLRVGSQRVMLITSSSLSTRTDEIQKIKAAAGAAIVAEFNEVPSHAPRDAVLRATELARSNEIDLICTIGGGSVTEAGKGVQLCLANDITELEQLDELHLRALGDGKIFNPLKKGPTIRQIAVPTTLSGGEFNKAGGMMHPRTRIKHAFSHRNMIPRSVIYDPFLSLRTPIELWLSTGIKALDHAVEALLATNVDPYSASVSRDAISLLAISLKRTKVDPNDVESRADAQAGVWLSSTPVIAGVSMGASHALGRALGGTCNVPHGITSCVLLPAVLEYNADLTAAAQRTIAAAMGRRDEPAPDVLRNFIRELGLPASLSEIGIESAQFDKIAINAMQDRGIYNNPRPIRSPDDVTDILKMAA